MTSLSKNKDTVIQKSERGNFVDEKTHVKRMENLLSDQKFFERVTMKNDAFLTSIVNHEKHIDTILKICNVDIFLYLKNHVE